MGPWAASIKVYRPRCGLQDAKLLKKRKIAASYTKLSEAFRRRDMAASKCSPERLAVLIAELREFMDYNFGAEAPNETRKKLPLIPARLFGDFSEGGSVHCILDTCFEFAAEHNIAHLDFLDESKHDLLTELLLAVERRLRASDHVAVIKAFISPSIPEKDAERIRSVLHTHGAAILSNPDVATHVIYPDPPGTREHQTDGQVLVRMLKRGVFDGEHECFVHWFFHPDSYDDWVPKHQVLGHVFSPARRSKNDQWHIHARFLRDTEVFNEWMNELDYEMPMNFNDFVGRPPIDISCLPGPGGVSKVLLKLRISKEKALEGERDVEGFRMVGLPSIESEDNSRDKSQGGSKHAKSRRSSLNPKSELSGATSDEVIDDGTTENDSAKADRSRDQSAQPSRIALGDGVFMPSFAKWFQMNAVHEIEQRALPEFFSGRYASKNEHSYREIRNFIIRTWRKNPTGYLSGTAARRYLSGDSCCILRVHGFLEHWGLINYACPEAAPPPSFNPPPRPLPVLNLNRQDDKPGIHMLLDDGSSAELVDGKIAKRDRDGVLRVPTLGNVVLKESGLGSHPVPVASRPTKSPVEYHCDSCKVDCSVLRFHCATKADVDLCASCYQAGRYAADMKPRDFIQMNSTVGQGCTEDSDPNVWTESEILLLLEALEMFTDKWTRISEHVGSKTKSQCVMKFLQLPIEDAFLKTTVKNWWSEHPVKSENMPSPMEIMRKAGSRESSLAAIAGKGSARRTHSGQPLVCADQISTIAPFVAVIAACCPSEKLEMLLEAMDFQEPQKRVRNPFRCVCRNVLADTIKKSQRMSTGDEAPISATKQMAFTNTVYSSLASAIRTPDHILKSDFGEYLRIAVSALVDITPAEGDELDNLRFHESPWNSLRHLSASHVELKSDAAKFAEATLMANGNGVPIQEHSTENGGIDKLSSPAIALSSLASACVVAAQWRNAEEVEVDRLLGLCLELRLAMIRLKMKQLSHMEELEEFVRQARKRHLITTACEAIRIKRQRLMMEEGVGLDGNMANRACESAKAAECDEAGVAALAMCQGEHVKCMMKSWTEVGGLDEELKKMELPDYNEEEIIEDVRLKKVEKTETTGASQEVSEEEGEDNMDAT
eukprot:gb/GEZJ01004561.1/.p1 GENE.gb/GEZJ01004561.1/~~gb/GEZJ01004561.1/.p1  ORF type:complete len:1116 (-),score=169.18 gb/GEZJ01004561.1/:167-3514(-)